MVNWVMPFLLLASLLIANSAVADPAVYVLCKLHGNVRTLRVEIDANNICHTHYSKEGVDKVIGSGRNHESCKNFLQSTRTNLEKSSWSCRDVATATVTEGGK